MTHHHDAFFKAVFGERKHAVEHLAAALPPALVATLDLSRAKLVKGSFVDEHLHESHTDLIFRVPRRNAPRAPHVYLYLLFEHQSTMDPLMPLRLLRYELRIWAKYLRKHPGAIRLPPIIPLVLYHGERPWTAPMDIFDMIDVTPAEAEVLRPYGPHTGYILEDLGRADDRDIPGTGFARLALLLMKHIWRPGLFDRLGHLDVQLRAVSSPGGGHEFSLVVNYLMQAGDPEDLAALKELTTRLGPEAEEIYMTIAEQIRQEAAFKARQIRDFEIAEKLLAEGLSAADVARITDLPIEEVNALAQKVPPRSDRIH